MDLGLIHAVAVGKMTQAEAEKLEAERVKAVGKAADAGKKSGEAKPKK